MIWDEKSFDLTFMLRKIASPGLLLILLAIGHGTFAWKHRDLRPQLNVLTPAPSVRASKAIAVGDEEFLYRLWAIDIQNAGDTGGRATPMREYDYSNVISWLSVLQSLAPQAQLHTALAAEYFSQTPIADDVRKVIRFIADDVPTAPQDKWPWLIRAAQIAETRLKDTELALSLIQQLNTYAYRDIPFGARALIPVFLEKLHKYDEARAALVSLMSTYGDGLTEQDRQWTQQFIQRLPQN